MSSAGKVLVIGGGLAGCAAVKGLRKLNKSVEIVLVEPKDYCETLWAAYRSPFDEATRTGSLSPLAPFCAANNVSDHIRTTVTSLTTSSATLDNGESVDFDVCVVATGAVTAWPSLGRGPSVVPDGSMATRKQMAEREGEAILSSSSKSVLICGGGLVGTELAGDVAGYAKRMGKTDLQVTLVHSGDHLCPEMSERAAGIVKKQLEAAGVKVILNELATDQGDGTTYKLKSGETITADRVILTTGLKACNEFMSGIPGALDDRGFLATDDCFRVAGCNGRVFGMGDCCVTLPNSGSQLLENIKIIGFNVNATVAAVVKNNKGETSSSLDALPLKKFKLGPQVYLATTGPSSGVMYSSFLTTKRFFPWLKNKTMFFFRIKSELGLMPSSA